MFSLLPSSVLSPLKRVYKFVLKKFFGEFLLGDIDLNQLDVQLSEGTIEMTDLQLNINILNDLLVDLPLVIVRGRISRISARIPWMNLLEDHCQLTIEGLEMVVVPSDQTVRKANLSLSSLLDASLQQFDETELLRHIQLHRNIQQTLREQQEEMTPQQWEEALKEEQRRIAAASALSRKVSNMSTTATSSPNDSSSAPSPPSIDNDSSSEGLKVVASFLEHLISQTEVVIHNVTLKIAHQQRAGDLQTVLTIKLPYIEYADLNKQKKPKKGKGSGTKESEAKKGDADFTEGDAAVPSSSSSSSSDSSSSSSSSPSPPMETIDFDTFTGPRYEYHKAIRFHGFRVELHEEVSPVTMDQSLAAFDVHEKEKSHRSNGDSSPFTIIHGDVSQDCLIQLKVKMADSMGPKVETSMFINNLRALLTPRQLALLIDLFNSIASSSRQVALQQAERTAKEKAAKERADGKMKDIPLEPIIQSMNSPTTAAQPLGHADFNVIEDLLHGYEANTKHSKSVHSRTHIPVAAGGGDRTEFFEFKQQSPSSSQQAETHSQQSSDSSPSAAPLQFWSLESHILHVSLTLLEDDAHIPSNWWLSPHPPVTGRGILGDLQRGETIVSPFVTGISNDHLLLSFQHVLGSFRQTSVESIFQLSIGHLQVQEYLKQVKFISHSIPHTNPLTGKEEYQQIPIFVGFKAHDMIQFHVDAVQHSKSDANLNGGRPKGPQIPSSLSSIGLSFASSGLENESHLLNELSHFIQSTQFVLSPHFRIDVRSSVGDTFHPHPLSSVGLDDIDHSSRNGIGSRAIVELQPLQIDFDLGIADRFCNIYYAILETERYVESREMDSLEASQQMNNDSNPNGVGSVPSSSPFPQHPSAPSVKPPVGRSSSLSSSPQSQFIILAPRIHLNVSFPADTPCQRAEYLKERKAQMERESKNGTSSDGDGLEASLPIDTRGPIRSERLLLEALDVAAFTISSSNRLSDLPEDIEWNVRFSHFGGYLTYCPDESQRPQGEKGVVTKQVVTTNYSENYSIQPTSDDESLRSPRASSIKILLRAPLPSGGLKFHPLSPEDASFSHVTADRSPEEMFFDSLPNFRWWEPLSPNSSPQTSERADEKPTGGGQGASPPRVIPSSNQQLSAQWMNNPDIPNLGRETSEDDAKTSSAPSGHPDSYVFESRAMRGSEFLVSIRCPSLSFFATKTEFDFIIFLYTIYAEVTDPIIIAANAAAQRKMEREHFERLQRVRALKDIKIHPIIGSATKTKDDDVDTAPTLTPIVKNMTDSTEDFESKYNTLGDSSAGGRKGKGKSKSTHQGLKAPSRSPKPSKKLLPTVLPSVSPTASNSSLDSLSSGESDSDSEMFESVVAADSVILRSDGRAEAISKKMAQYEDPPAFSNVLSISRSPKKATNSEDGNSNENPLSPLNPSSLGRGDSGSLNAAPFSDFDSDAVAPEDDEVEVEDIIKSQQFGMKSILLPPKQTKEEKDSKRDDVSGSETLAPSIVQSEAIGGDIESSQSVDSLPSNKDAVTEEIHKDVDPFSVFSAASAASRRAQMFQPPTVLQSQWRQGGSNGGEASPPVDVDTSSSASVSNLTSSHGPLASRSPASSMAESLLNPELFHSFLPSNPPAKYFIAANQHLLSPSDLSAGQTESLAQLDEAVANGNISGTFDFSSQPDDSIPLYVHSSMLPLKLPKKIRTLPGMPPINPATGLPFLTHQHYMSLRLIIDQGSMCLIEDYKVKREEGEERRGGVKRDESPSSADSPQTFFIDLGELQLFAVVRFDGTPTNYISVRAGDLTLREYQIPITINYQLCSQPSLPILFKTMSDDSMSESTMSSSSSMGVGPSNMFQYNPHSLESNPNTVAWKNPVLICSFLLKLNNELNVRETSAVINLRALTWQFFVESNWILKVIDFFTDLPTASFIPQYPDSNNQTTSSNAEPLPSTLSDSNVVASVDIIGVAPLVKELVHLYLHAYDCSIDYNPIGHPSRGILAVDHLSLTTTIYPDTDESIMKIEGRDAGLYLLPRSLKCGYSPAESLCELPPPFLHRVAADSLFDYLDVANYARVATLDYVETTIKSKSKSPRASSPPPNGPHIPPTIIEMTNGKLSLFTCWDSWQVFLELSMFFIDSISEVQKTAEIDIIFNEMEDNDGDNELSAVEDDEDKKKEGEGKGEDGNGNGNASNDDDDKDHGDDDHADGLGVAAPSRSPPIEVDLLSTVDHSMFGPDMGVPKDLGGIASGVHFIDNYQEERKRQTTISLALQKAAERTIAMTSQPRPLVSAQGYSAHLFHTDGRTGSDDDGTVSGQNARWYSQRESDERAVKDAADAKMTFQSEEDRLKSLEMERELEMEQERRRRRWAEKEKSGHGKRGKHHIPIPPKLIEHHILPEEELIGMSVSNGAGKGLAAVLRHRLQPPPGMKADMLLILYDVTVVWRMFGGDDWIILQKQEEPMDTHEASPQTNDTSPPSQHLMAESPPSTNPFISSPPSSLSAPSKSSQPDIGEISYDESMARMNLVDRDGMGMAMGVEIIGEDREREKKGQKAKEKKEDDVKEKSRKKSSPGLPPSQPPPSTNPFVHRTAIRNDYIPSAPLETHRETSPNTSESIRPPSSSTPPAIILSRGQRETDRVIEVHGIGLHMRFDFYPLTSSTSSRMGLALDVLEVHDLLSSSSFKKFLCYYRTDPQGRELNSSQLRMEMVSVRPDMRRPEREEYRMKLSSLPVRLNVDQDAVEFLVQFFNREEGIVSGFPRRVGGADGGEAAPKETATNSTNSDPIDTAPSSSSSPRSSKSVQAGEVVSPVYIQMFSTSIPITVCIDYKPKRINFVGLKEGDYSQLMNLFSLEGVELLLKRVKLSGLDGWDRLFVELATVWGNDIARHQVHRYLAGVQPMRSIVSVGSGVADLILLPLEQYQRNGRVSSGLQKGAKSFVKNVTMETVNVTTRFVQGAQSILESVDEVLTSKNRNTKSMRGSSTRTRRRKHHSESHSHPSSHVHSSQLMSKMSSPPRGLLEGLRQAYESLSRGLQVAAHEIVAVPREEYYRGGTRGAVKAVVKSVPAVILKPMIGATEAISRALLGVQAFVDPIKSKELEDKYKDKASSSSSALSPPNPN